MGHYASEMGYSRHVWWWEELGFAEHSTGLIYCKTCLRVFRRPDEQHEVLMRRHYDECRVPPARTA